MSRSFLRDAPLQPTTPPLPRGKFRLLTIDDLLHQPSPESLIENFIGKRNFIVIYGAPAVSKSFVALHIALCIASGLDCFGRKVRGGPVVYVTAEGEEGYKQRVAAWLEAHPDAPPIPSHHAIFLPDAVNLLKEEIVDDLLDQLGRLDPAPVLLIFDTLARCMVGGDENSSRDIGLVVDAADRLRKALGCSAIIIHHSGRKGNLERGSTSIRGAADTMISVRKTPDGLKLVNVKQKNSATFKPIPLAREVVELGEITDSCIVRFTPSLDLSPTTRRLLVALADAPKQRATFSELLDQVGAKTSMRRALQEALSEGLIQAPLRTRGGTYRLKGPALSLVGQIKNLSVGGSKSEPPPKAQE